MNNHIFCAPDRFKGLFNQMLAALHQYLHGNVIGNIAALNQCAQNFIFRFGRGRKADFNFFYADVHKRFEHLELFFKIHRVDKRLIAVTQIDGTPHGRFFNRF